MALRKRIWVRHHSRAGRYYQWGTSRNLEYKESLYALPEMLDVCRLAPMFVEKNKLAGCLNGPNTVVVRMAGDRTRQEILLLAEEMTAWVVEQFEGEAQITAYRAHGPTWVWAFENPTHAVHFKLRWG